MTDFVKLRIRELQEAVPVSTVEVEELGEADERRVWWVDRVTTYFYSFAAGVAEDAPRNDPELVAGSGPSYDCMIL